MKNTKYVCMRDRIIIYKFLDYFHDITLHGFYETEIFVLYYFFFSILQHVTFIIYWFSSFFGVISTKEVLFCLKFRILNIKNIYYSILHWKEILWYKKILISSYYRIHFFRRSKLTVSIIFFCNPCHSNKYFGSSPKYLEMISSCCKLILIN